jgi:CBS domain-containing protein
MALTARDVMTPDVRSVGPELALPDLERALIEERVGGFPVVEHGRLVGIVSRSDVIRQLCVERIMTERVSDFYVDLGRFEVEVMESFDAVGRRLGARIEGLCVKDVMSHDLITVSPLASLREVASTLVEHRIHRVPVADGGRLVGILSSLHLVRLFAEERVRSD